MKHQVTLDRLAAAGRLRWIAAVALLGMSLTSCNTMYFQVSDRGHERSHHDRKAYFLWGLAPTREIDMREHCPNGVAAIREETTVGDGLLRLITIGIYSPRSSNYYCLRGTES